MLGLLVHIADGCSDGADDARLLPRHARNMLHEIGCGGLAVGPRDADEREGARGVVVELSGSIGERLARIGDDDLGHVGRIGQVELALHDEHLRTAVDRVLREGMSVHGKAHDAEERIAGLHAIGAIGDARNLFRWIAENGAIEAFE